MGNEVIKAIDNFNKNESNSEKIEIVCGFDKEEANVAFPIYNDINSIKEKICIIILSHYFNAMRSL